VYHEIAHHVVGDLWGKDFNRVKVPAERMLAVSKNVRNVARDYKHVDASTVQYEKGPSRAG
jgi:hypothetical protein